MFSRILIANRGAIAVRICRTLEAMNIESVAVYAESDLDSAHIDAATHAYSLGDGAAADTYLNQRKLLSIVAESGAEAVHPGYGFLSENAEFAAALANAGVAFIGPAPEHIRQFGLKHEARRLAEQAGVATLPGSPVVADADDARRWAAEIGYPVMLKSSAGGGGIGMMRCADETELLQRYAAVSRLAAGNFGDDRLFVERYVDAPRHVEVQALGDGTGGVLIVGDRDCSLQRRHQKVIEECPAPGIPDAVREQMQDQARALLSLVSYRNVATVEFLYDTARASAYFLEVNTRLQVEHGVTEMVYYVDLVRWMIEQAAGELAPLIDLADGLAPSGHAIQARIYAENPQKEFAPCPGEVCIAEFADSPGVRVDTWLRSGAVVSPYFDPMLAKVIAHAGDREAARNTLRHALSDTLIQGIETNCGYLGDALDTPAFVTAAHDTDTLAALTHQPRSFDVVTAGAHTTIQAFPGRQGYWAVGVPPSGPMDDLSFRLGNRLIGNPPDSAGLEITMNGPTLRFNADAPCLIAGDCDAECRGQPVAAWTRFDVYAGDTLQVGKVRSGARAYLLVAGGLKVAATMGSAATFTLGGLGGLNGRALATGDVLHFHTAAERAVSPVVDAVAPDLSTVTDLRVTMGPHSTDDYFTAADIDTLLAADWTVHYNSSRTGIRLIGPQPTWARNDGGEAGLHPSNIHDNAYAFGTIDFTGDMPVILGPDGPSLGGFVCPATVINADRWKLGQLTAGDQVRFRPVSERTARSVEVAQERYIEHPGGASRQLDRPPPGAANTDVIVAECADVVFRRAGQDWLLIEFGPPVLDIAQRLRVHAVAGRIEDSDVEGIVEMTPGIRSLQLRFDSSRHTCRSLAHLVTPLIGDLQSDTAQPVASRIVHLPLSWDDPACRQAAERYTQSVRADAPWCPDNIEFIRRINGLDSAQAVKDIVFDASYLVMGLGDVYLGAPVATPLDPRHRLVTTKYNPARTWTAENSVGIGGSYLCVYGMEGPGGYQFVGRTVQMWDRYQRGRAFTRPWLLRPFDQIRFFEVGAEELLDMRKAFPRGGYDIEIEPTHFDCGDYGRFLARHRRDISAFTERRQQAFDEELEDWRSRGLLTFESAPADVPPEVVTAEPPFVASPMSGSIWSIAVKPGQLVEAGDVLFVLESMKAEFEVVAPIGGVIGNVLVIEGQMVRPGQALASSVA